MDEKRSAKMDAGALWREDIFTDRHVGTIRRMTPVKPDGSADPSRKVAFVGEAALMTPAGQVPLTFDIPAEDLAQAVATFGTEVEKAYRNAIEELERLHRQASSRIVIPKAGLPPGRPAAPSRGRRGPSLRGSA